MNIYVGLFPDGHAYAGHYQRICAVDREEAICLMADVWAQPFVVCEEKEAYTLLTGEKQLGVTLRNEKSSL